MEGKAIIENIITNACPVSYEDVSQSHCRVLSLNLSHRKIIVAYPEDTELIKEIAIEYFLRNHLEVEELVKYNKKEIVRILLDLKKRDKDIACFIVLPDSYNSFLYKILRRFLERKTEICPIRFPHFGMANNNSQFIEDRIFISFVENNIDKFSNIYDLLYDQESKDTLKEIIRCAAEHDAYRLPQATQKEKYWEYYLYLDDECFVNCGSAKGDTILTFLNNNYPFERIYAFEGNHSEYKLLLKNLDNLEDDLKQKIITINEYIGTSGEKNNFDSRFKKQKVSLINMDIEGAELAVLQGGVELIKRDRPVLAICAYHKKEDLIEIPALIRSIVDDYVFVLRKYIGEQAFVIVNEYLYYAIPRERLLEDYEE